MKKLSNIIRAIAPTKSHRLFYTGAPKGHWLHSNNDYADAVFYKLDGAAEFCGTLELPRDEALNASALAGHDVVVGKGGGCRINNVNIAHCMMRDTKEPPAPPMLNAISAMDVASLLEAEAFAMLDAGNVHGRADIRERRIVTTDGYRVHVINTSHSVDSSAWFPVHELKRLKKLVAKDARISYGMEYRGSPCGLELAATWLGSESLLFRSGPMKMEVHYGQEKFDEALKAVVERRLTFHSRNLSGLREVASRAKALKKHVVFEVRQTRLYVRVDDETLAEEIGDCDAPALVDVDVTVDAAYVIDVVKLTGAVEFAAISLGRPGDIVVFDFALSTRRHGVMPVST